MTHHHASHSHSPAVEPVFAWRRAGALGVVVFISACGGGGGGATTESAGTQPTQPTPTSVLQQQTVALAKGVVDSVRVGSTLAADVQNIVVWGPVAINQREGSVTCSGGGTLTLRVLRPATDPAGGLFSQQYSGCTEAGLVLQGGVEVGFTRRTSDGPTQPWAGTVRFDGYSVSGGSRQRQYHGLATAQGEVQAASGGQTLTMRLQDFRLRDVPDTLGLGVTYTTTQFDLARVPLGLSQQSWSLAGRWLLDGTGLQATLDIAAGSRLGLLDNSSGDGLTGRVSWSQQGLPLLAGGFGIAASGATALRVQLDLNEDGQPEHTGVLERVQDLGLRL